MPFGVKRGRVLVAAPPTVRGEVGFTASLSKGRMDKPAIVRVLGAADQESGLVLHYLVSLRLTVHAMREEIKELRPAASSFPVVSVSLPILNDIAVALGEHQDRISRPIHDYGEEVGDVPTEDAHVQGSQFRKGCVFSAKQER